MFTIFKKTAKEKICQKLKKQCRKIWGFFLGAIVNSSRKILTAWQQGNSNEKDFAKCAREEAKKMQKEINSLI